MGSIIKIIYYYTKMELEGNKIISEDYSFVDLIQKNGKVTWETVNLS